MVEVCAFCLQHSWAPSGKSSLIGADKNLVIARAALAAAWFYQGLWHQQFHAGRHSEITAQVPCGGPFLLPTLRPAECALALWILCGRCTRERAWEPTILLVTMNVGGLAFARAMISTRWR